MIEVRTESKDINRIDKAKFTQVAFRLLRLCEEQGWIVILPKFEEDLTNE